MYPQDEDFGIIPVEAQAAGRPIIAFGRTPHGPSSPTELVADLKARCVALGLEPPLVACDLEQGAGLHFAEGTLLPPALALMLLISAFMGQALWDLTSAEDGRLPYWSGTLRAALTALTVPALLAILAKLVLPGV